jgi:hypothetical protein
VHQSHYGHALVPPKHLRYRQQYSGKPHETYEPAWKAPKAGCAWAGGSTFGGSRRHGRAVCACMCGGLRGGWAGRHTHLPDSAAAQRKDDRHAGGLGIKQDALQGVGGG